MKLEELRGKVDLIDAEVIKLLSARMETVAERCRCRAPFWWPF